MVEKLTNELYDEIRQSFVYYETYSTVEKEENYLDSKYIRNAVMKLGLELTEAEIIDLTLVLDKEKNGKLYLKDYIEAMAPFLVDFPLNDENLIAAFSALDRTSTGFISPDDLKAIIRLLGQNIPDEDIDLMIKESDKDGDGRVNFDEFVSLMRQE